MAHSHTLGARYQDHRCHHDIMNWSCKCRENVLQQLPHAIKLLQDSTANGWLGQQFSLPHHSAATPHGGFQKAESARHAGMRFSLCTAGTPVEQPRQVSAFMFLLQRFGAGSTESWTEDQLVPLLRLKALQLGWQSPSPQQQRLAHVEFGGQFTKCCLYLDDGCMHSCKVSP